MNKIKPSVIALYTSVFALIMAIVSVGYYSPQESTVANNITNVNSTTQADSTSVDSVIATSVAANVAQVVNLPVATSVANLAVSAQIKSEITQLSGADSAKPQLIETVEVNRSVINYTTVAGDTVPSLAVKFNISAQTIKWANNLTADTLSEGKDLRILPIDGVLYSVKDSDTIDSIATKYKVDTTRLVLYNDLDVSGLKANTSIILPGATLPETERPGYVAPYVYVYSVAYGYSGGDVKYLNVPKYWNDYSMSDAIKDMLPGVTSLNYRSDGNTMALGNCTWWSWERRKAINKPLPGAILGDAGYWSYSLGNRYGYKVDKTPEVGAIFQDYGHVGIVESITRDDAGNATSFTTSEMNYNYVRYQVVSRTIPASNFNNYNYIH